MDIDFKLFIDNEFPNAYVSYSNHDERRINCISEDCPNPKNHMFVNVKKRKFVCHRCTISGDYKAFLCMYYGMSYRDIKRNYGALYGVKDDIYSDVMTMSNNMLTSHELDRIESRESFVIDLPKCYRRLAGSMPKTLVDRSIEWKLIRMFKVGICRTGFFRNRLIIPVFTGRSRSYIAYTLFNKKVLARYKELHERYPDNVKYEKNKKKILNPKSSLSSLLLFNYDNIPVRCNRILIVEGVFDVFRAWSFGMKTVGIFGISLSNYQRDLLLEKDAKEYIFMFDGDVWKDEEKCRIVERSVRKMVDYFDGIISVVRLEDGIDPDDIKCYKRFGAVLRKRDRVSGGNFIFSSQIS